MGNLFIDSFNNHQSLINELKRHEAKDNICYISQPALAKMLCHSQTWVEQAIKRINSEDECIKCIGLGKYTVAYDDLSKSGVFSSILFLMAELLRDTNMFYLKDQELAVKYNKPIRTIQMFKSYVRTDCVNMK